MPDSSRKTKLYIAEEQQILRDAYLPHFASHPKIEVVGSSSDTTPESVTEAIKSLTPDVVYLGGKALNAQVAERLERFREISPDLALVLAFASYDPDGLKSLKEFSRSASPGYALLLKHTIDTVEDVVQAVYTVMGRRIIVDAPVMEGLVGNGDSSPGFIGELSRRELEVMSWMAKGYRNDTIAEVLRVDPRTVERHINKHLQQAGEPHVDGKPARVRGNGVSPCHRAAAG